MEYSHIPKAFLTPHNVGRCCTDVAVWEGGGTGVSRPGGQGKGRDGPWERAPRIISGDQAPPKQAFWRWAWVVKS